MTDVTITRLQNRRGRKVDLPQPLQPGEIGLCEDTHEIFIGRNASESNSPAVNVFSPTNYPTVNTHLTDNIIVADLVSPSVALTKAELDNLKSVISAVNANVSGVSSLVTIYDGAGDTDNSNIIIVQANVEPSSINPAIYRLYISIKPTYPADVDFTGPLTIPEYKQQLLDQLTSSVSLALAADSSISTSVVGTGLVVNEVSGTVDVSVHSIANSIASCINFVAAQGIVTSSLNLQILTGNSSLLGSTPADFLARPIEIDLPPSPGNFSTISNLVYDIDSSDALFIDYTVSYHSGANQYSSTGKLSVAVNQEMLTANVADETNEVSNVSNNIYFRAEYAGAPANTVSIQYQHDFPTSVTLKVMTNRWSKF